MQGDRRQEETRPGLVLIHGAAHAGDCWAPTVAELARQAPDLPVLAVDLPGRRDNPADLRTLTIAQCVDSVIEQVAAAGLDGDVVVVGHSLAGLVAPGVVARLGAGRVRRLVLVAAIVPPEGGSVVDTLRGPTRWLVARAARRAAPRRVPPRPLARWLFCNGMDRAQREYVLARLCEESTVTPAEPVSRTDLPASVPRTWVLPRRDRMVRPRQQRRGIDALGGVEEVLELDTGHDAMVGAPSALAAILASRCEPVVSRGD